MANPAPTINQINAFNATQGTTIDFNIIGGTELVRSNKIYIYDLSDNSLICTHLYVSTESIHELPANTDGSIVYESGKSSADFVNGAQYYAQIQTFTDIAGTQGGSGLSVSKLFWCLVDPSLTIATIPSSISTTSYNVSATYDANTSVVSNIIQQYQFNLYSATGSLLQSSGVVVGNGEQQGTSTAYDISYNFSGLSVGSSYYVAVDVTTTQGMSISAQSSTFTVSIDTPTLGEATVVNNACDGYISVTSNLSSEYGGSASGEIATFETDSVNNVTKLEVALEPTQEGTGDPSPSNVRPITGHDSVTVYNTGSNLWDEEWEVGGVDSSNGQNTPSQRTRSKGYVPCLPNTSYCYTCPYDGNYILFYDAKKAYISYTSVGQGGKVFTTPTNAYYIRFCTSAAYGTTYNNDISINYPSTDHDYHAYNENSTTYAQSFNVTLTPTVIDETPYLFKQTGDVRGDRESLELVGGTVNWNQLCKVYTYTSENAGITYVKNANGTVTMSGTATGNSYNNVNGVVDIPVGHKVLLRGCPKGGSASTYYGKEGYQSNPKDYGDGIIVPATSSGVLYQIMVTSGATINNVVFEPIITDLTAFFGNSATADYVYSLETANAGAGIAWLRKYFPDLFAYSPYNTGTLESVKPTAHVTRGVNQWDEEWENGQIYSTGAEGADANSIRSKNYNPCAPNTVYYGKSPSSCLIVWYDANKDFISRWDITNTTVISPTNAKYFRISCPSYGSTYQNNICINISNPALNGKYFPADHHTYPITELELRGIPKLVDGELRFDGDTRKADGTVTRRWAIYDLGNFNWVRELNQGNYRFRPSNWNVLPGSITTGGSNVNIICSKYVASEQPLGFNTVDKAIGLSNGIPVIRDDSCSTAEELKSALNGVYIVYQLATPTTETADPFTDPQEVSIYGTEEFVSSNGVPVGNKTTYKIRDIFGGTINLASGVLTVDRVMIVGGWEQYAQNNGYKAYRQNNAPARKASTFANNGGMSNMLTEFGTFSSGSMNKNICELPPTTPATNMIYVALDENVDISGLQISYLIANPLTYQLTPQQIETLIGTNNVWSNAGDVSIEFHIPITNLLVKRQDVADVSGNWLTLYSQPVEQASDMDFTFIDFLNQYGKKYQYALVPLLTQTQSGVEVEVEGGYTVSDEVQSIFDGVYIGDSTGVQRLKAGIAYNNLNTNQQVGVIPTLGNKYPIIVSNGNIQYDTGSVSGLIVPDDFYSNGNLSRLDMSNKREAINDFLTNKKPKILKDWNGNIWLVVFTDNVDVSFDNNYGMGVATFTSGWTEVGDPTNQEDLQRTGLINVGGD